MVSIVIAVFNGGEFLDQTIKAALEQDTDVELIIVDDCSDDNSVQIAEKWIKIYPQVSLFKNHINKGFCRSANIGISHAKGEYVLVLGQDDLLEKSHVTKMLKLFSETDVSVVYCDYFLIDENGYIFDKADHCIQRTLTIHDFIKNNAMPSCGAVIRKSDLNKVGGYPEFDKFPHYGEWYLWIKLAENGRIYYCDSVRSLYRRHNGNMTNNFKDSSVKKVLNRYGNTCRLLALKSKKMNVTEKLKLAIYICYKQILL